MSDSSALYLKAVNDDFEMPPARPATFKTKGESAIVESGMSGILGAAVSEMNREEVKARLEASEARVATSMEALRGDLSSGLAKIDVGLAKMDTSLAQILAAVEKGKSDRYAAGYKIITWTVGTVIALGAIGMTIYRTFWLSK